jgi:hypothetical protein
VRDGSKFWFTRLDGLRQALSLMESAAGGWWTGLDYCGNPLALHARNDALGTQTVVFTRHTQPLSR